MIVCIEGIDGAGKQTQAEMLRDHFKKTGKPAEIISFPDYNSEYGKTIDRYLHGSNKPEVKSLFLLYLADIANGADKIKDADSKGVAILDRYYFSTIAYQCSQGFDYGTAKLIAYRLNLPQADKVIYLDISPEDSLSRKKGMGVNLDRHERDLKLLESVSGFYLQERLEKFPNGVKWLKVDAMQSKEVVHNAIVKEVDPVHRKFKR